LAEEGITPRFVQALEKGEMNALVAEAYGPAPFVAQASRLAALQWPQADGSMTEIKPVCRAQAAFGARPPVDEAVFLVRFSLRVKGSTTVAEGIEGPHMAVALSFDAQT